MRIRTVAAVGVTLLALTACGATNGADTETSAPAPSETAADVAWAESICQRADELDASVAAIASSVSIDPQAGDVLDQLQQQIVAAVDTVKGDVVDLATAVADVPKGSDPALTAASEQLTTDKAALESSIDALKTAATTFSEADGVLGKVTAFGTVSTAAKPGSATRRVRSARACRTSPRLVVPPPRQPSPRPPPARPARPADRCRSGWRGARSSARIAIQIGSPGDVQGGRRAELPAAEGHVVRRVQTQTG